MHEPERTTLAADHGSAPHPETAAAGGGFAAGYRHGFTVVAAVAAGLALAAALAIPAVRPAPGARVAVH